MIFSGDQVLINRVVSAYTRDNERLVDQLNQILYYWRGALGRDDVYAMSPAEREKAVDFLNTRFKEISDMSKKGITVFY